MIGKVLVATNSKLKLYGIAQRAAAKYSIRRYRTRKISDVAAKLLPISTVVDIGAAAYPHEQWHSFLHSGKVTWILVEPDMDSLTYTDSWKYESRFIKEHRGIAELSGPQDLYVTNVPTGSSLLEPSVEESLRLRMGQEGLGYFFPYDRVSIECVALNDLLIEHRQTGPAVVKLDTQGSELSILQGATQLLRSNRLVAISTEITLLPQPAYKNSGTLEDFQELMLSEGYELVDLQPIWVRSTESSPLARGYLNECDALYMPRLDRLLSLDLPSQLAAVGIFIDHGIYGMAKTVLNGLIGRLSRDDSETAKKLLRLIKG